MTLLRLSITYQQLFFGPSDLGLKLDAVLLGVVHHGCTCIRAALYVQLVVAHAQRENALVHLVVGRVEFKILHAKGGGR